MPTHAQQTSSCAVLCLLAILLAMVPVSILVYLLELRLRYRYYAHAQVHRQLVPSLEYVLCQQGMQLVSAVVLLLAAASPALYIE